MEIGSVLSRAWQIIWKHKILWLFGILAGCGGSNVGSNSNFRYESNELPANVEQFFNEIDPTFLTIAAILIIIVVLILVVIGIFLGTMGRIGLIQGTLQAENGAAGLSFGGLFNSGLPYFWRIFLLNLLVGLATAVIIGGLIVLGVVGAVITLGVGLICLVPFLCLLVPLIILVNIVLEQVNIAIVVENLGIMEGLQRGWDVFTKNLGNIIVIALILGLGISLIGGAIISLPMAAIVGPAIIGILNGSDQAIGGGILITAVLFIIYLPIMLTLGGILRSYIGSAWTLTYLRLTRPSTTVISPAPATPL